MSSQPKVVHVIHNPNVFIAFKAIGSQPRIAHIILNLELFISSRGLSSWMLSRSYHPQLLIVYSILSPKLMT